MVADPASFIPATARLVAGAVASCLESQDKSLELGELLLLGVIVLTIFILPFGIRRRLCGAASRLCRLYARHKGAAIVVLGLLPAAARIAILPAISIPIPVVPDEFSHLLLADTIGAGRIANPPHPLAPHFEATYVLQHPSYASVYPPAHGILMGLAELAGLHPWFGVLAEVSLMTMAMAWMLDAWFSPRWVLLGTLIAVVRLGVWMTCYWGGSLAAIGGALVVGSLKRIWDGRGGRQGLILGLILGLGMAILLNTRPYEGSLSGLFAGGVLAMLMFRRASFSRRMIFRTVLIPLAGCLAANAMWMAYYNWKVTGDPLMMPYVADQRASGVPQSLIFNPPQPAPPKLACFKDLMDNYKWELEVYRSARDPRKIWETARAKLATFWHFYLHPLLLLPLLALPWTWRDSRMRVVLLAGLFVSFGIALYPFYFAHYSAPIAGVLMVLLVQGFRHISVLTRKRPGGGMAIAPVMAIALSGISFLLIVMALVFHDAFQIRQRSLYPAADLARDQIERRLCATRDKHLVLVRYGPQHVFHQGMTYNHADIDRSMVVWARALDAASNTRLLSYYSGRTVWLYEPDETPPRIGPWLGASVEPGSSRDVGLLRQP